MHTIHFNEPETLAGWTSIDDRVMGGVSRSQLTFHPEGHAVFEGQVSRANGGGFASVRHGALRLGAPDTASYGLNVCGDGRRYKLSFRLDMGLDGVNYQAGFQPPAGQWVAIVLPLHLFSPSFRGRPVPGAPTLRPDKVCQVGLMVADGQAGPFRLAVRSVTALPASTGSPAPPKTA